MCMFFTTYFFSRKSKRLGGIWMLTLPKGFGLQQRTSASQTWGSCHGDDPFGLSLGLVLELVSVFHSRCLSQSGVWKMWSNLQEQIQLEDSHAYSLGCQTIWVSSLINIHECYRSIVPRTTLPPLHCLRRCKIEGCKNGFTTKQCLQFHYKRSHGLNEEEMPKIEREVPYTMTAYSGLHGNATSRRVDSNSKDGRIFRTKIRQEKTPRYE